MSTVLPDCESVTEPRNERQSLESGVMFLMLPFGHIAPVDQMILLQYELPAGEASRGTDTKLVRR